MIVILNVSAVNNLSRSEQDRIYCAENTRLYLNVDSSVNAIPICMNCGSE